MLPTTTKAAAFFSDASAAVIGNKLKTTTKAITKTRAMNNNDKGDNGSNKNKSCCCCGSSRSKKRQRNDRTTATASTTTRKAMMTLIGANEILAKEATAATDNTNAATTTATATTSTAPRWLLVAFLIFLAIDISTAAPAMNEAYFNGSAYLRLLTPMPIWDHSAISFRSCRGGEIFAQQYNRNSIVTQVLNNLLQISLAGPDVNAPDNRIDANFTLHLLDNKWHTLQFKYENDILYLHVDHAKFVLANSTYNTQFLTNEQIGNEAAILILGNSFTGCLLDGPGLQFVNASMTVQNVVFGVCPLSLKPCGVQNNVFNRINDNYCATDPCMGRGTCISQVDGYACNCTARYTGKNCQMDNGSPCAKGPCLNSGTCVEDSRGDFKCLCPPHLTGPNCDIEMNLHQLCQSNPCLNNGDCVVMPGSNAIKCDCPKGFDGARCELDVDECASNPCLNGGRCIDKINGYACDCSGTGYSGASCELNVNECETNPCLNGGLCYDTYGTFICKCPDGWGGDVCEKPFTCQTHTCMNGGTCVDTPTGFHCVCAVGYSGDLCQSSKPCPKCPDDAECIAGKCICKPGSTGYNCEPPGEGNPTSIPLTALGCHNGGKCLNGGTCSMNGTHCYCPAGYSGERCEKIEPCSVLNCQDPMVCSQNKCICPENKICKACALKPCRNEGICADVGIDGYECKCPAGWTGRNCEQDVDECEQQPKICGNGICKNEEGSFKCYCTPGWTGIHCDSDVDECLSHPCMNGATCHNKINAYECVCPKGYTGKNCEIDIDECQSNPCTIGSTCVDLVNDFSCVCIPGMTGRLCEIDIDDCVSMPCLHGGQCIDELNGFHCNCNGTGFEGNTCEINIDECATNMCTNGADCIDLINDYECQCNPGYRGKNCDMDIDECESNPCQYNGTCLERSNTTLYRLAQGGADLPESFHRPFSYRNASGYECVCVDGTKGKNCEINIDECESNPCSKHGTCKDGVGTYTCECDLGYEGTHCEKNIDECERYQPCLHGTCIDLVHNYNCDCDAKFGGQNCSVPLTGCDDAPCQNKGLCKPYVINETQHLFNCTCPSGFQGATCEKTTTISMIENSLITVGTRREEGYDISLQFRTAIPNGVLAFGTSGSNKEPVSYILELINGRLNLHSSLLNKWEGVFIGSKLNDSKWHKVFVAINTSHLVLSANDEQAIFLISTLEANNTSPPAFPLTYLGGTIPNLKSYLRHLTHRPSSFVGCMQDIVVNEKWIFPGEPAIDGNMTLTNIVSGCPREKQCHPNPCHSNGECTDLWYKFKCNCQRPHFGHTCEYNITAATFGHENTTHSAVIVETNDAARRAIRSILDISMFIRTREPTGHIFYLGSDRRKPGAKGSDLADSYVAAELAGGELRVKMQFNSTPEAYTVGGNKLNNGYNHLIEVVRNQTLVQVKLNGTEFFRKTLSSTGLLDAQVLYLGGPPPTVESLVTSTPSIEPGTAVNDENVIVKEDDEKEYFKGIIQDVKISNGSSTMIVELYPLNEENLELPPQFGEVTIDRTSVLKGEVTDDLCRHNPCKHYAECRNTWNDYVCTCPNGYKGKNCQEIEFCQLVKCPGQSECQNLDDGYECLTNITFTGKEPAPLAFAYYAEQQPNEDGNILLPPIIELAYRTRAGGTLLYIENHESFFEIGVNQGQVTVTWKLNAAQFGETKRFTKDNSDLEWSRIYLRAHNNKLEGGWKGWESMVDPQPAFSADIEQDAFEQLISNTNQVYLGGMPENRLTQRGTTSSQQGSQFKGCLGEARVGELLLPYFHNDEMYPKRKNVSVQPTMQFRLNSSKPNEGCVLCFQADCKNGGKCKSPSEQYACECELGYEGDDCSIDIDECQNVICQNNGTCIDKIYEFICSCQPGYEGTYCEHNIDECASQPCQNGANCTDLIAAFRCDCTEDYAGILCDVLKEVTCANQPCMNGSTCEDTPNPASGNNFTCHCLENFEGPLCDVSFCEATPCLNGGLCLLNDSVTPLCQCRLGFTGRLCETDIDECATKPCLNGGQCHDQIGTYTCECSEGFTGVNCEIDIDECSLGLGYCGYFGRCINLPGSFKCACQDSFCGVYCNFTDPCKQGDEICMNGGLCFEKCDKVPDYYCNCTMGFEGKNCSIKATTREADSSTLDIAIIVVPIVVFILIVALVLLGVFFVMARNKRATRGTYSPSAQEYCNPRLEMDNVLKPPPEERLI